MQLPMIVLAIGCFAVVAFARPILTAMTPVIGVLFPETGTVVAEQTNAALVPVNNVVLVAGIVIGLTLALTVLRKTLLFGREVGASPTWDCGYAAPAASMQYTASSFAQPIVAFHRGLLRTRTIHEPVTVLFPESSSLSTETPDLVMTGFYANIFQVAGWVASRLAWIQHGRLSFYVLYIAVALFTLLSWCLGTGDFPAIDVAK